MDLRQGLDGVQELVVLGVHRVSGCVNPIWPRGDGADSSEQRNSGL